MNVQHLIHRFDEITSALQTKLASCRKSRRTVHVANARKEIQQVAKEIRHFLLMRESGLTHTRHSNVLVPWGPSAKTSTIVDQVAAAEQLALEKVGDLLQAANDDGERHTA